MLLNQLRSCQGKPSATKIDDFFHGGWFKKQNCNFSMNGPHIWTEKHKKHKKSPPPEKKEKERRQVQYFCRKLAIC